MRAVVVGAALLLAACGSDGAVPTTTSPAPPVDSPSENSPKSPSEVVVQLGSDLPTGVRESLTKHLKALAAEKPTGTDLAECASAPKSEPTFPQFDLRSRQ